MAVSEQRELMQGLSRIAVALERIAGAIERVERSEIRSEVESRHAAGGDKGSKKN